MGTHYWQRQLNWPLILSMGRPVLGGCTTFSSFRETFRLPVFVYPRPRIGTPLPISLVSCLARHLPSFAFSFSQAPAAVLLGESISADSKADREETTG